MDHHDLHLIEIGEKAGASNERQNIVDYVRKLASNHRNEDSRNWISFVADQIEQQSGAMRC